MDNQQDEQKKNIYAQEREMNSYSSQNNDQQSYEYQQEHYKHLQENNSQQYPQQPQQNNQQYSNQQPRQYPNQQNYGQQYPQQPSQNPQNYGQQQYPNQQNYGQQYPQQPRQQPVQQYPGQQSYGQQYPQQPQQSNQQYSNQNFQNYDSSEDINLLKNKKVIIGIALIVLIIALAIFRFFPSGEQVTVIKDPREQQLLPQETISDFRMASNNLVYSDEIIVQRLTDIYDIGDYVYVYSVFEDFEQKETENGYQVELVYGIQVSNARTGEVINRISNNNIAIIRAINENIVPDYYFTATIPTLSLSRGIYTVKSIGTDRLTGKRVEKEINFELREPDQLKVVALILGDYDEEREVLVARQKEYYPDDVLEAYFEIRGFDFINNTPDVIVDLFITNEEGIILQDVSKRAIYVNNITYSTAPVQMMVNLRVPLQDIKPGQYNLQLVAQDNLPRITSFISTPFTVRRK